MKWLKAHGSKRNREGIARYAIPSQKAFGLPVSRLRQLAKRLGRNHDLAEARWATGRHEVRMLAAFVDEPARVTAAQMER
ncbi:MAG TPA: DNA alkylation repair protein [Terriglobales bacterium]|nr:DNA alkylation repair protein [Terriglobales bacterium]